LADRTGYDLVERHFYSPLPDLKSLKPARFEEPSALRGVRLDSAQAIAFLEGLSPYLAEFSFLLQHEQVGGAFRIDNGTYESVDAEALYAVLRSVKPARVIELGSGSSSYVIDEARRQNSREDRPFEYRVFDPYPWAASALGSLDSVSVQPVGAVDVALSEFKALEANDVLFVDTTHTVKTGGDVTHLVLEVLPILAPGVLIHFHDVFLPYEYPRDWVITRRRAWAEQYLLHAFLAYNPEFDVLLPLHAVSRAFPERLGRIVPTFGPGVAPGGFWMRRRDLPSL